MKKNYNLLKSACLSALLAVGGNAFAQGVEGVDLEVYYMNYISASAQQNVHPSFYLHNNGSVEVQTFAVEVTLNDEAAFTENVTLDEPLAADASVTVNLEGTVFLPFGQTSTVGVKVVAEGDVDETNNSASNSVTMPEVVAYPYTWSLDDCQTVFEAGSGWFGGGWEWNADQEAFYMFGKGTNWMYDISSKIFDLPQGENVTISFEYAIQAAGKMKVTVASADATDEMSVELTGDGQFHTAFCSFESKGPATISFMPTLDDVFNYAGVYVRNINVKKAVRDLAASAILSPATSQMAVSSEPIAVQVRFTNVSPFDIENPEFVYDAGDGNEVRETYDGIILGGATLDYTFKQTYTRTEAGTATLAAWCEVSRDGNADNDRVEKEMTYYEAVAFPYHTTYDEGNELWANVSGSNWAFGQISDGGVMVGQGGYVFSPAIQMPAGTARVSFYYGSIQRAGANLKLYMGRSTNPDEMTEVLFDKNVTNGGWLNGYHLLNIEEAGNYYFAFLVENTQDQVIIDNFKVDAEEDLCMHSVTFDQESGFNLTEAKVTLGLVNHGVSAQKGITLRYYINSTEENYVEEVCTDEVLPGDTLYYEFQKPVDVSATDSTYTLVGQIVTVVGEDTMNDMIVGQELKNYAPYTAPYYYNFADETQNGQWTMPETNGNRWNVEGNFYAYDGNQDLKHTHSSYTYSEPADDWAYSPCIMLEPGEYEVSFMHRGRTYFGGEDYAQSFEAKMGMSRTPEGMTISISRHENLDYEGCMNFKKDVARVVITEAGQYYLGFHNFSEPNSGELHIDAVQIAPVEEALPLPFETTFADGDEGWTKYNDKNASGYFPTWNIEDGVMQLKSEGGYVEGMLVSPRLALEANKEVTVEVEYEVTSDDGTLALNVFDGNMNTPQAMTLKATGEPQETSVSYTFSTGSEARDFYLGLHSSLDINENDYLYSSYTLKINRVKVSVKDDITDGIQTVESGKPTRDNEVYDLQGRRTDNVRHGLYIQNGRKVVK